MEAYEDSTKLALKKALEEAGAQIDEINKALKVAKAAPDLLAACLMAREELVFGGDWETAKQVLTSAIDKATK